MSGLPTGRVTLLFTDIEGSTHLLQKLGDGYPAVLDTHREVLTRCIDGAGGAVVGMQGDAVFGVFASAEDAVRAALEAQTALVSQPWPGKVAVRVRMGLHTGEPTLRSGDYVGLAVHQAARICSAAHGGQVVLSDATARASGAPGLRDLGW